MTQISEFFDKLNHFQRVFLLFFIALVVRLLFSFFSHGFHMGDEVGDYLDAPMWMLYKIGDNIHPGYFLPDYPIRSHMPYYLMACVIKFSEIINITNPIYQSIVIRFFLSLWSSLTVICIYYITRLLYPENKNTAFFTSLLSAVWGFSIYADLRTLGESLCTPLIIYGLYLSLVAASKQNKKTSFFSGLMLGLGVCFKFQNALFFPALAIYGLVKKKFSYCLFLIIGLLVALIFQGFIDLLSYGSFLTSLFSYIKLQFFTNFQLETHYAPAYKTIEYLFRLFFVLLFPFVLFFTFKDIKRNFILTAPAVTYIVFHLIHPLKQLRFFFPILPIFLTTFMSAFSYWAINLSTSQNKYQLNMRRSIYIILILGICFQFSSVFFPRQIHGAPKWQDNANLCFAENFVGMQKDSTGFLLYNTKWVELYFYIRKNIPVLRINKGQKLEDIKDYNKYNYLIIWTEDKKGRPVSVDIDSKILEDFQYDHQPIKKYGDHWIYKKLTE